MIAEKTPYAAVMDYQDRIQRLLSCVTLSVTKVAGGYQQNTSRPQRMELNASHPVILDEPHNLLFKVQNYFHVRETANQSGLHHIEVAGYHYVIYTSERHEILAYHWHPGPRGFMQAPHVHLGSGAQIGFDPLITKAHLPTGYVTLKEIIRFLIEDLSVLPRQRNWQDILQDIVEPSPSK